MIYLKKKENWEDADFYHNFGSATPPPSLWMSQPGGDEPGFRAVAGGYSFRARGEEPGFRGGICIFCGISPKGCRIEISLTACMSQKKKCIKPILVSTERSCIVLSSFNDAIMTTCVRYCHYNPIHRFWKSTTSCWNSPPERSTKEVRKKCEIRHLE